MTEGLLEEAGNMKAHNVKSYSTMLNETRLLLQQFYRPWNRKLQEMMGGDPRWSWGYGNM